MAVSTLSMTNGLYILFKFVLYNLNLLFLEMASTSNTDATIKEDVDSDDDYEEIIMIADLKGVLDASTVTRALSQNNVGLRFANTDQPVVQVGSSMFTGGF